jgi:hypothetical protein
MNQGTALDILKTGRNVYLTGAAGTGKTYVLNEYIRYLRERGVSVGVTASTGIAATHLGGLTIHSWSGIGVRDYLSEYDLDDLTQKQYLAKRFEKAQVLIIDEVSMLAPHTLDMVDEVCRAMKRTPKAFGGMQAVFSGDFFQLPPIVNGESENTFADTSRAWRESDIRVCYLTEQFRQTDSDFSKILNDLRGGNVGERSRARLNERMHADINMSVLPTRLYTHNIDVNARNAEELNKIKGESKCYEMSGSGRKSLVESLKRSVLAPEIFEVKEGAAVMFVKNNFEEGYVNGTLGTVKGFESGLPIVETADGRTIVARHVQWEVVDEGKTLARVLQIPLRLAWAITVHKSQGMTLDAAEVDLSKAFTPGQGYVALSRVRHLQGLKLLGLNETALAVHPYVCELDARLQNESSRWDRVITGFPKQMLSEMHTDFMERIGGSEEPLTAPVKKPTHEKTYEIVSSGKSVSEAARERGLTKGTIVGHLEKIAAQYGTDTLKHIMPAHRALAEIKGAFSTTMDGKLTPVHRKLKGRYSFDELRVARLFIKG